MLNLTYPPENLAARKSTVAPEHGAGEADPAAGELSSAERTVPPENWAPLKSPPSKTTPVKSKSRPCQDVGRVLPEVSGDDPDDGVADFPGGLEGKPLRLGSILAGVGLIRHPQVSAQHVDAGLPVLLPVISQARHGVHPG